MKKIVIPTVFIISAIIVSSFVLAPATAPVYVSPEEKISPETKVEEHEAMAHIRAINDRNAKIHSLYVPNVAMKVRENRITVRVNGELSMEKPKNFRLTVESIVGEEMDIGSNNDIFWFWSRRGQTPDLYYAKHEDLAKAMLKMPLNPTWMMESMCIGKVDTTNVEIIRHKDYWAILQKTSSARGEPVTLMTLIDPSRDVIIGRYLYNSQGRMEASTEVKDFYTINGLVIPKTLIILWYSEGKNMEWELQSPQINKAIDPSIWKLPNSRRKVDMGKN
jgi:hypothetical protein